MTSMLNIISGELVKRYLLHVRMLWHVAPRLSALCLVSTLLSPLASAAAFVGTGRLVESLATSGGSTWTWLTVTALALVLGPVTSVVSTLAGEAITLRYMAAVSDMLVEVGTDPYGTQWLEEPATSTRLDALSHALDDWLFVSGITAGWAIAATRLTGVSSVVVLMTWSWWAPIIVVAGWLVFGREMRKWTAAVFDEMLRETSHGRRRARYFMSTLVDNITAKEVRLYGLVDWLVDRFVTTWHTTMAVVWSRRTSSLRRTLWAAGLVLGTNLVIFGLLAKAAWEGFVSVGHLVTLVLAILSLSAFGALYEDAAFARTTSVLAELAKLRRDRGLSFLPRPPAACPREMPVDRPEPIEVTIQNVTFRYPSRQQPTLANLTLHIPPGQSVAIVGVNGAGKTTLLKLLCGLYRPDSGTVRVGGLDPGSEPTARRRIAAIFQDFVRFHWSLKDNIDVGAITCADDTRIAERALKDAGGLDLVDDLEYGWQTILSAEYSRGSDLSGGQWQRVALARALAALSAGAGLLVLDEPTAAQDVRAEAELFDRFLEVTRGVTTILVSHRLSSVRHAERIVVLDDPDGAGARIVEDGNHAELMDAGGVYARLFRLQAARFTAASGHAEAQKVEI